MKSIRIETPTHQYNIDFSKDRSDAENNLFFKYIDWIFEEFERSRKAGVQGCFHATSTQGQEELSVSYKWLYGSLTKKVEDGTRLRSIKLEVITISLETTGESVSTKNLLPQRAREQLVVTQ